MPGFYKSQALSFNFILAYLLVSSQCFVEPVCSKFPYEEALLEKMIRMEFNVHKMLEDIKTERENMLAQERSRGTPDVLFRAKDVTNCQPAEKQAIVFETVEQNEGGAYNSSSGIFTAPITGQYFFTAQFCMTSDKDERNNIYFAYVIDDVISKRSSGYFKYYTCVTSTFLTKLISGSRVWIKSIWKHQKPVLKRNNYLSNTFSGVLIKKSFS